MTIRHYVPLSGSPDWAAGVVAGKKLMLGEQRRSMGSASFRNDGGVGKVYVQGRSIFALVFGYNGTAKFGGALPELKFILREADSSRWFSPFYNKDLTTGEVHFVVRTLYRKGMFGYIAALYYPYKFVATDEDVWDIFDECGSKYWYIHYTNNAQEYLAQKTYYNGAAEILGPIEIRVDESQRGATSVVENAWVSSFDKNGVLRCDYATESVSNIDEPCIIHVFNGGSNQTGDPEYTVIESTWPLGQVDVTMATVKHPLAAPPTSCLMGACYYNTDEIVFNGESIVGAGSSSGFEVRSQTEKGIYLFHYFGPPQIYEYVPDPDYYVSIIFSPTTSDDNSVSYSGMSLIRKDQVDVYNPITGTTSVSSPEQRAFIGQPPVQEILPAEWANYAYHLYELQGLAVLNWAGPDPQHLYLLWAGDSWRPEEEWPLVVPIVDYGIKPTTSAYFSVVTQEGKASPSVTAIFYTSALCSCDNTLFGMQNSNPLQCIGFIDTSLPTESSYGIYDKRTIKGGLGSTADEEGFLIPEKPVLDEFYGVNSQELSSSFAEVLSLCSHDFLDYREGVTWSGMQASISEIIRF